MIDFTLRGRLRLGAVVTILALFTKPAHSQGDAQRAHPIERGRQLFMHVWKPGDPLSPGGNGLGPMNNAASCVECHAQGGVGGAGPNNNNVQLLTVVRPADRKNEDATKFRKSFRQRVREVHRGFIDDQGGIQSTIVFHRFSLAGNYERWRETFWGVPFNLIGAQRLITTRNNVGLGARSGFVQELPGRDNLKFKLSERNTPALFGLGLIDSIDGAAIQAAARDQAAQFPGISGRMAGRFGWRGQVNSLQQFVLAACAVELGLEVAQHHEAVNPLNPTSPIGVDLTDEQCTDLVAFVASLPKPIELRAPDRQSEVVLNNGRSLFHSVGCTACHLPGLGNIEGIYSDLLLHDMGAQLADPSPAMPEVKRQVVGIHQSGGSVYGGGSIELFANFVIKTNIEREWRTPPLWGLADAAPYLHDGRAKTVEQAILMHGGEATQSMERYQGLPELERARILAFLSTLRAPNAR